MMTVNNLLPRTMKNLSSLEYGDCFIYNNALYMKIAIYDAEDSERGSWENAILPLPGGYADTYTPSENPIVECVDVELNIVEVLN